YLHWRVVKQFSFHTTPNSTQPIPPMHLNPLPLPELPVAVERGYRRILGIRFFVGDAPEAVEIGARGGLVVVPAAPALLELGRDQAYRQALLGADLAIT